MAKFLKIQDKYINVEHISYVEIKELNDSKIINIYLNNNDKSISFILPDGLQYNPTTDEIEILEAFLVKNLISIK